MFKLLDHFLKIKFMQHQTNEGDCGIFAVEEVFCKCHLQEAGKTIYFEGCSTWYHSTCENIPKKAWAKKAKWLCLSCH